MKRFKSITVNENTFNQVDRLTEKLLPGAKLSRAQVVANCVKGSHEEITNKKEDDHEETNKRHTEDPQRT
jgi:hypothetical protein|tara:strand:- start:3356 stop:3565 length:210 start_codon:yes stop_codon:yes gene_type:complete